MQNASKLVISLILNYILLYEPVTAAEIRIGKNPYGNYYSFIIDYIKTHNIEGQDVLLKKLAKDVKEGEGLDFAFDSLNKFLSEQPYDETTPCAQLGYVFTSDQAIFLNGELQDGDGDKFKAILESRELAETELAKDNLKCLVPVIIDSFGGDLDAAFAIGHQIRNSSMFAIVPQGGNCFSACVFVLLAARFETEETGISKAMAFSDAHIGAHWPRLTKEKADALKQAFVVPNSVFSWFGSYWTEISKYIFEVTNSGYMSFALWNSIKLREDEVYMIDSTLERRVAGITNILVPWSFGMVDLSTSALANECLKEMVKPGDAKIAESMAFSFRKNDIFWIYYPLGDTICFIKIGEKSFRKIVLGYRDTGVPIDNALVGGKEELTRVVRSVLWNELEKLGLNRRVIGVTQGIGKAINGTNVEKDSSVWDVYSSINPDYQCVQCGELLGTVMFDGGADCGSEDKDKVDARYLKKIQASGFPCVRQLTTYVFAKMLFDLKNLKNGSLEGMLEPVELKTMDIENGPDRVRVSKSCPNPYQVCSRITGSVDKNGIALHSGD